jgi:hypothetical protein
VRGPGAVAYARRAGKGRRYTALVMLFAMPLCWIALGAFLLAAGLGDRSQIEPVTGWPQTNGWVAGVHSYQPYDQNVPTVVQVIAFRADGRLFTFGAKVLTVPPTVGTPVRVAYDPRDPADAHDLSAGSGWEGLFFLGVGIVNSGFAFLVLLWWLVFVREPSARRAIAATSFSDGRHARSG